MMELLLENFHLCRNEYQMNPLIILTRCDQIDEDDQIYIKSEIARRFGLPEYAIYMYNNYQSQTEKKMSIDRKSLEILRHTIECCQTFRMHNLRCHKCDSQVEVEWVFCPKCKTLLRVDTTRDPLFS